MNKPAILFVITLTTLICGIDYVTRLLPQDNSLSAKSLDMEQQPINVVFVNEERAKQLTAKLSHFDVNKKKTTAKQHTVVQKKHKPKLMSAEEQAKQNGLRKELFNGEDKYALVAIYQNVDKKFVLLSKKHLVSGAVNQIKLYEGDMLANYRLAKVANNQIDFVQGNRTVSLQLFALHNS